MSRYGDPWNTEMHWVASYAARKRRRVDQPPRRFPLRYGQYLIMLGEAQLPYGRGTSGRAYLTHIVDEVYLIWLRGRFKAAIVRWRCGATCRMFRFMAEPDSTLCVVCPIERPPPEKGRP